MTFKDKVALVGADECDQIGIVPNKAPIQLHAEAARRYFASRGIDKPHAFSQR